ncbi:hypothetical protein GCM10007377_16130 [Galliscardovia ingluviei]|uniref:FtsK domain-containing protein n=1 Tax=Galliscardovia ingluviei TaxID=1769422 RepID=A0A8J3F006_9BIFI|nr:cell division protein FtsK [Galliscardovia ingluviei]GGI15484.1 hypothetical protein GCM10007377_16130 [Galliscardovia ingluviei]
MDKNPVKKISLKKLFPNGFNPDNGEDTMRLNVLLQEKAAANPALNGYTIIRLDHDTAYIAPVGYETEDEVAETAQDTKVIGVDPTAQGNTTALRKIVLDLQNKNEGYTVTEFARKGIDYVAYLRQLDEKTITVRYALADALQVEPYELRLKRTPENGWHVRVLKDGFEFRASKHHARLQESIETSIGKEGWWYQAFAEQRIIIIHPGKLPTFPARVEYNSGLWDRNTVKSIYFGMKLPDRGRETGDPLALNLKSSPGILVAGETSGGKSTVINSIIYGAVMAGCVLAICDDEDKSVDFTYAQPWVMRHGYGCDGKDSIVAVLTMIMDECKRRAEIIKQEHKMNYWELDESIRKDMPPIMLICDEIAQWAAPITVPAGLAKDDPTRIAAEYEKGIHAMAFLLLRRITQKARFTGICFLFAAQSPTANNGLDPSIRTNLTSKILLGETVSDDIRKLVLKDARKAPKVPENVKADGVGKGTGVAELGGIEPAVFKGYYMDDPERDMTWADILCERLEQHVPHVCENLDDIHWTRAEIIERIPFTAFNPDDVFMEDMSDEATDDRLSVEGGFGEDGRDVADRDKPLTGAAAAAHALNVEARIAQSMASQPVAHSGLSGLDALDAAGRDAAARGL